MEERELKGEGREKELKREGNEEGREGFKREESRGERKGESLRCGGWNKRDDSDKEIIPGIRNN